MHQRTVDDYLHLNTVHRDAWFFVERNKHSFVVKPEDVANASVYDALLHFLRGDGVYIPPRTVGELHEMLERFALSFMFTHISLLRRPLHGAEFRKMKEIAFSALNTLIVEHKDDFISLHINKPNWHDRPNSPVTQQQQRVAISPS